MTEDPLFDYKSNIVRLHIDNMLTGRITVDFDKLISKSKAKGSAANPLPDDLVDTCKQWLGQYYDDGSFFDPDAFEEITDFLYDVFFEARFSGIIVGALQDISAERTIVALKKDNEKLQTDNTQLKENNTILASELHKLQTTEPPIKKDFSALR